MTENRHYIWPVPHSRVHQPQKWPSPSAKCIFSQNSETKSFKVGSQDICTVFNAQNAGNHISELLDFNFFWGGGGGGGGGRGHAPRPPPRGKGPGNPFSGHSCLLHLQWPLITKVIETPVHNHWCIGQVSEVSIFK